MVLNLSKYIYFLLFSIFIFLLLSSSIFEHIKLTNNFIFLFSVLIIPVVDIAIEKIRFNSKLLLFVALILFWYTYIFSITWNNQIIETSLIYSYVFLVTWAITQYAWFIVDRKNESITKILGEKEKTLSEYFYIFYLSISILFLLWLFYEVVKFVFYDYNFMKLSGIFLVFTILLFLSRNINIDIKKILKKYLDKENLKKIVNFRTKINNNIFFKKLNKFNINNDIAFYLWFILFLILFLYWFLFNIELLVSLSYIFLFLLYIAFKVYWFKIDTTIHKNSIKNTYFLNNLTIYSVVFWFIIFHLLDWYWLNNYKVLIISIFILLFILVFSLIFSKLACKKV